MAQVLNHTQTMEAQGRPMGQSCKQLSAEAARRLRLLWNRVYIYARRLLHSIHDMSAEHPSYGAISFLAVSAALGLALTFTTLYSSSYEVLVEGQPVGIVASQDVVENAMQQVEHQGSRMLGRQFQLEDNVEYQFALTLKSDLDDQTAMENYFYEQLAEVSAQLRKYQVVVNGLAVGSIENEAELDTLLDELKGQYINENTISAQFVDTVRTEPVYTDANLMSMEEMRQALTANKTGETTYTVQGGDTFNGIAFANNMSISDLEALNPGININRLMIGDILNVKEIIPLLSVTTVEDVTYTESIPCPVETVEDNTIYQGSSKIKVQGVEGEALVNAHVTYLNGKETEREVLSQETLREPTVTIKAIGTKPRPKTASTGTYSWPIYGRITSYFGGRYIFGSYSYHSGIDISASYGAPIYAADGGTVTFSGWKGTYGKLVIITHDNGTKTYYAHNSSLLVSAGQKVYKGQQIAKAGSTGRSTGTHCHFEVRVNGTAVNPLSYLQ